MRILISLALLLLASTVSSQTVSNYLESIRNNRAALTAFFSQMPKGGDLHHHFSGSIYAEPMLKRAIAEDLYLNTSSMKVSREKGQTGRWVLFSTLKSQDSLNYYKQKILQQWSVRDYDGEIPSHQLFFDSFDKYGEAEEGDYAQGLLQLKNRAIKENLSYIETQFEQVHDTLSVADLSFLNSRLRQLAVKKDEAKVMALLDSIFNIIGERGAQRMAEDFNQHFIKKIYDSLQLDDPQFTYRFQNFVLRFREPVTLFKNLVMSFYSANSSPLIVGVNIVAPEHGDIALQDYWLHMIFYKFCHSKFPAVKYSMHAGELALGLVQPEEMNWHINAAVRLAGAKRIGHGVDIANEAEPYALLDYMKQQGIAVEINLVSNEFILKVKEDRHPILLYKKFGVPIVISTDDAGVLRTNMTEQYVLLAYRYPELKYSDIKEMVYNSIKYSFIKEDSVKKALLLDLDKRFKVFEDRVSRKGAK